eukprot:906470_1
MASYISSLLLLLVYRNIFIFADIYDDWHFEGANVGQYHYSNVTGWQLIFDTLFDNDEQPEQLVLYQNANITNNQLWLEITQGNPVAIAYLNLSATIYNTYTPILVRVKAYRMPECVHCNSEVQLNGAAHVLSRETYRGWPATEWEGKAYCAYITDDTFTIIYNNGTWFHCSSDVTLPTVWNREWFVWTNWWIPYRYHNHTSIQSAIACTEREKLNNPSTKSSVCGIVTMESTDRFTNNNKIVFGQTGWFPGPKLLIDEIQLYHIDNFFSNYSSNGTIPKTIPFPSTNPMYQDTNDPTLRPSPPPTSRPTSLSTSPPTSRPTSRPTFRPTSRPTSLPIISTYEPSTYPISQSTVFPTSGRPTNLITPDQHDNQIEATKYGTDSEDQNNEILSRVATQYNEMYNIRFLLLIILIPFISDCFVRIRAYNLGEIVIDKALVLIIGISKFENSAELPGVERNVRDLEKLWNETYNYTVKLCQENTLQCSKMDVEEFIDSNMERLYDTPYKAVIVHVLSHGFQNKRAFITSDSNVVLTAFIEHELISTAELAGNSGMLKLIFHHACRGDADYSGRAPQKIQGNAKNCCAFNCLGTQNESAEIHTASDVSDAGVQRGLLNDNTINDSDGCMDAHLNCITLYGTLEDRTISDEGQFTDSICEVFHRNATNFIHNDLQESIREIGNRLEDKTGSRPDSKGLGTLRKRTRFQKYKRSLCLR